MAPQTFSDIETDNEFESLLPPLPELEIHQLEQNILSDGCRDPLVVWKNGSRSGKDLLVDGHNRLRICKRHDIPFEVKRINFEDRDDAIAWIIRNQIGRRNLNLYQRCTIALKLEPIIKAQAKKNQSLSKGRGRKGRKNATNHFTSTNTNDVLARIADTSSFTIKQTKHLQRHADQKTKQRLDSGQLTIRGAVYKTNSILMTKKRQKINESNAEFDNPAEDQGIFNQIMCLDVMEGLKKIPDNSVHLIITSPPYGCGANYGSGSSKDQIRYQDYLDWLKKIWGECDRVMVSGARLAVVINSMRNWNEEDIDKEFHRPLFADLVVQMREIGQLKYRDRIIWIKENMAKMKRECGLFRSPTNPPLNHNSEDLIIWSKGSWKLQPPYKGCPNDLDPKEYQTASSNLWFINSRNRNKAGHPCPFPKELVKRLIKLFTYPGQAVLDPFAGICTVGIEALKIKRQYICIEKSPTYCKFGQQELEEAGKELNTRQVS